MIKIVPNISPSLRMVDNGRRQAASDPNRNLYAASVGGGKGPEPQRVCAFVSGVGIVAHSSTLQTEYAVTTYRHKRTLHSGCGIGDAS